MKKICITLLVLMTVFTGCSKRGSKHAKAKEPVVVAESADKYEKKDTQADQDIFVDEGEVDQLSFAEKSGNGAFAPESLVGKESIDEDLYDEEEPRVGNGIIDEEEWESRQDDQIELGFKKIYFDFDRYNLREDQGGAFTSNLGIIQKVMKQDDKANFLLEGHTCHEGSRQYNLALSNYRAEKLKKEFVSHGVPADRIKTVGRGSELCLVTGDRAAEAANRRVEFYVLED